MKPEERILVAGVTGKQGGAVARHLRAAGFTVRGLTRDPGAAKARSLREAGIELAAGDLTDRASLELALQGATGVFAMATPFEAGMKAEVAQGMTLGDAARAAGVKHYVYSSVGGADRESGVPHFETKWRVEGHLRQLGLPLTVVRPVWFFENLSGFAVQPQEDGYAIYMPLPPERTLQGIAVDDIGALVALAFGDPQHWLGEEVELAGDELSLPAYAAAIATDIGAPVQYIQVPRETIAAQNEDLALMFDFFQREGYQADIAALRQQYPGLRTFDTWLREGGLAALRR
jgi:uncharacterized protein YbjT (DUF2867 family)